MFIVIGELLILRASLLRKVDPWSWVCAAIGSVGSILLNIIGVGSGQNPLDYVIAAVPPVAALLAFGILMRQLHEAITAYVSAPPKITPGSRTVPPGALVFDDPPVPVYAPGTDASIESLRGAGNEGYRAPAVSELPEAMIPIVPDNVITLPVVPPDTPDGIRSYVDPSLFSDASHDPVVYFLRNGQRVKIGTTTNTRERIKRLSLRPEDVLLALPGDASLEDVLHEKFSDLRIKGTEWFRLSGDLVDFLRGKRDEDNREPWKELRPAVNGRRVPMSHPRLVSLTRPQRKEGREGRPPTGCPSRVRDILREVPGTTDEDLRDILKSEGFVHNTINKSIKRVRRERGEI
jgi:hypothetical protein